MKKLKNQFRVPFKSFFDTIDMSMNFRELQKLAFRDIYFWEEDKNIFFEYINF